MINDILTGLRVPSQIPLDDKKYVLNEAALINLGPSNNLAYTYHKGLEVLCIQERTLYEWKEIEVGDVGLLPSNFTYPAVWVVNGIDYSNAEYNFVQVVIVKNQDNFVRQLIINQFDLPIDYTEQDVCDYILALPADQRTILETDSKWNIIVLGFVS